jgi:esterase/lipase
VSSREIEEYLKSDIHWWEISSFKNKPKAHPLLYEDLKNHYPDMYQDHETSKLELGTTIQSIYRQSAKPLRTIEEDHEFKVFEKEFEGASMNKTSSYLLEAIFLLALSVDKSNWPNIYSHIKPKLDKMKNLQNKFYNSVETQKVRDIIQNMTATIDRCINRIEKIISIHITKFKNNLCVEHQNWQASEE